MYFVFYIKKEAVMSAVPDVTSQSFKNLVTDASKPVVVDFWAPWCMPCRMLGPTIEQLAAKNAGTADVYKLNVDENNQTAASYGVMSIPTVVIFKGGAEVKRFVGVQPQETYQRALDLLQTVSV
jgi:thioredoxin 1